MKITQQLMPKRYCSKALKNAIVTIPIALIFVLFLLTREQVRGESASVVDTNSYYIKELKTNENWQVRSQIALKLGKAGVFPNTISALVLALDDRHEIVRLRATVALIELGTPSIPNLVESLTHEKERVRTQADFAIATILEQEKQTQPGCVPKDSASTSGREETIFSAFNPSVLTIGFSSLGWRSREDFAIANLKKTSRSSHFTSFGKPICSLKFLSWQELNAAIANLKVALNASNFTDDPLQQNALESIQGSLVELKRERRDRLQETIPQWLLFGMGLGIVVFCLMVPFENWARRKS